MTSRKSKTIWLAAALTFMAALVFYISQSRFLNCDELESLYASWLISKGQLPYRDFYQIHTPLAYYLFAPLFFFVKSLKVISAARAIVGALIIFNGFLLFKISRRLFDAKTAIAGAFFYLTSWPILYKMIEIRPDVFVAIFSNLSLIAMFEPARNALWLFFLGGVCSALAVLSKQSGFIFFIALIAFFLLRLSVNNPRLWGNGIFSKERFSLKTFLSFIFGFLAVITAFILLLRLNNAEYRFLAYSVDNDFLHGAAFLKTEARHWLPEEFNKKSFNFNPGIYLFALVSPFLLFIKPDSRRTAGAYIFVLLLASACFGALFLILHPWGQEFILPAQYFSIIAGATLIKLSKNVYSADLKTVKRLISLAIIAAATIFSALMFFRGIAREVKMTDRYPRESFARILSLTEENDKCLSTHFPCLFRPSVYFYSTGTNLLESGSARSKLENILIADIDRGDIKIILPSDKLERMPGLKKFIEDRYIMQGKEFFVPGAAIDLVEGRVENIDILVEGWYRIECFGAKLRIDGVDKTDKPVYLKRGQHQVISFEGAAKAKVKYDFNANKKIR